MADIPLEPFTPHDVYNSPDGARRWNDNPIRFLAQGDSWFSIGAMPPWATSNLLQKIRLSYSASVVNCAYQGRELSLMVDWAKDSGFSKLLAGDLSVKWNGILLSGGGNDLIAAASVLPRHTDGRPIDRSLRLLLKPKEWVLTAGVPSRYFCDEGWQTFAVHLTECFRKIIDTRDSHTNNRNVPLFCHCYDYPMPRNAPASKLFEIGPWLRKAVVAYEIPTEDWFAVAKELIDRLAQLLETIVKDINTPQHRNVFLINTRGRLIPASQESEEESNDWENEIHPTGNGYRKLADTWRPVIEAQVS